MIKPHSWEEATRPSKKEDFDWSPGWNKPDPNALVRNWAKLRVWFMNLHINIVMQEMFRWMSEESRLRLFIEDPGNKERHAVAQAKYKQLENKFNFLIEARNAYAKKNRVKAHKDAPKND